MNDSKVWGDVRETAASEGFDATRHPSGLIELSPRPGVATTTRVALDPREALAYLSGWEACRTANGIPSPAGRDDGDDEAAPPCSTTEDVYPILARRAKDHGFSLSLHCGTIHMTRDGPDGRRVRISYPKSTSAHAFLDGWEAAARGGDPPPQGRVDVMSPQDEAHSMWADVESLLDGAELVAYLKGCALRAAMKYDPRHARITIALIDKIQSVLAKGRPPAGPDA